MTVETWKDAVQIARQIRDESMEAVDKWFPPPRNSNHWGPLPSPLPKNVTKIPKTLLDPEDYEIVETAPTKLVQAIKEKRWTAVQVAGAYLRAAIVSQRLVNCVTEFLPERAYRRAKYLDEYADKYGELVGPFHGLPISVKELIGFGGHTQNRSVTKWVDNIAEKDALILTCLEQVGANFHIRTTEPQTYMCIESHSQLWGTTTNPHNTDLTPGGSSSGEAASLALHSSSVGIGTDIGGSIRWPAAAVGQYGFKPTADRLSQQGCQAFMLGCESIPAAIGPMTRDLESTILFTKLMVDSKAWKIDPHLNAIPWDANPLQGKKKVRIGVMTTDGVVSPHPPVRRALKQVTELLTDAGSIDGYEIEIVPYEPYQHKRAWETIMALYYEDGGKHILDSLAETGEPPIPLVDWIIHQPQVKELTIHELWERNCNKWDYRQEYLDYWNSCGIDALICPVGPGAATPHGNSKYWAYTAHWNLLDWPGAVFPVTKVDPAIDLADKHYKPLNEQDKFMHELYDPQVYNNAPVSLQLVGPRNTDEKVLEILKLIDHIL